MTHKFLPVHQLKLLFSVAVRGHQALEAESEKRVDRDPSHLSLSLGDQF